MCELFGVTGAEKINCNNYLKTFYKDSVNHPDGWGIARFYKDAVAVEKEPIAASQSIYLHNRLSDDIEEDVLLAHIRKASIGELNYRNTHPFVMRDNSGRAWTLIHNGTIFESELLEPYKSIQKGSCDSERILLYLIDQINKALEDKLTAGDPDNAATCQPSTAACQSVTECKSFEDCQSATECQPAGLAAEERFRIFDQVIWDLTPPHNKANLLAFDGELFYVHTNHPNSLYGKRDGKSLIFCTRPLDEGKWTKVPLNTLYACRQDHPVFCGRTHTNLFLKEHETAEGYDSLKSTEYFYI